MNTWKLGLASLLIATAAVAAPTPAPLEGTYDIHLYFDESPFLDQVTFTRGTDGLISGKMHVPDDFDAPIEKFAAHGLQFSFEFVIPKNATRPKALRAQYSGTFYDPSHRVFAGFGTIQDTGDFMASFVGHRLGTVHRAKFQ